MLRLIKFLYLRRVLLVFLLLEIVSLILLRKSSPYYSASYFSSSNNIVSSIFNSRTSVTNYFQLVEVNERLRKENALLKDKVYNRYESFKYLKKSYKNKFEAVESIVINNTINQTKNFLTIDIGTNEGVAVGMGVVGEEGVLGRVYAVNDNYSTITSILHSDVNTSVKVGKYGVLASMKWNADNFRHMKINYLTKHAKVEKGDSVYTSGYNSIYPEGIYLGRIIDIGVEEDKSFYDVKMDLANDFSQVKYAYVVVNKRLEEIKEVEEIVDLDNE